MCKSYACSKYSDDSLERGVLNVRSDSKTNRISKEKFLYTEKLLVSLEQGHFPKLEFSRENLAFITNNTSINCFSLCD